MRGMPVAVRPVDTVAGVWSKEEENAFAQLEARRRDNQLGMVGGGPPGYVRGFQ